MGACCKFTESFDWFRIVPKLEWIEVLGFHMNPGAQRSRGRKGGCGMKNALLLLSVWVGIIVAAYAMVYWDRGIEQPLPISALEPADSTYVDPDGRFSLVVPSAWDLEETETLVRLTDPSGKIEVTAFAVEESIPEAALLFALGIIDADPASDTVAVEGIPPAGASERAVKIAVPASGNEVSYGLAYLYDGESVVFLVRGDGKALEDRVQDLELIETGIMVPAVTGEETKLVEEAAPVVEL